MILMENKFYQLRKVNILIMIVAVIIFAGGMGNRAKADDGK